MNDQVKNDSRTTIYFVVGTILGVLAALLSWVNVVYLCDCGGGRYCAPVDALARVLTAALAGVITAGFTLLFVLIPGILMGFLGSYFFYKKKTPSYIIPFGGLLAGLSLHICYLLLIPLMGGCP